MTDILFGGRKVVLKALVGSHNYNLETPASDRDYKYFVAPSFDDLYDGKRYAYAEQTDTVDYDCHDIRQLTELIWKSNINFIEILFSIDIAFADGLRWLFADSEKWATGNLPAFYNATMGMHRQKMSELYKGTAKTDKLIAQFGYDTKQACHALRCLYVLERLTHNKGMKHALRFEYDSMYRHNLLAVKAGNWSEMEFSDNVEHWFNRNDTFVRLWFNQHTADNSVKDEMDIRIREFVKDSLI